MSRRGLLLGIFLLVIYGAFGQQSNSRIQTLLQAERSFAALVKTKGVKKAFLRVSDKETLIFRPGPVRAVTFFENFTGESTKNLSWKPDMARISKSGDWGFTTGPNWLRDADNHIVRYGQYLAVWKANKQGVWKLAVDLGIIHPPIENEPLLDFKDARNSIYFHQQSLKRLQQRSEVVLVNDRLFSTALSSQGVNAYEEFLSEEARLLFPGAAPIVGKENIIQFWAANPYRMNATPISADRSLSGDWAFTLGNATLTLDDSEKAYHYVRIWELQQGFNWNLVLEIFSPASN